jgi:transmembrane sensor
MSGKDERVRNLITREAADWFVANRAGLTEAERNSFGTWLRVSPVHVEEYLGLATIARDLRAACADSAHSLDAVLARARAEPDTPDQPLWPRVISARRAVLAFRWQAAALAMAALGVVSVGLILLWSLRPAATVSPTVTMAQRFETGHGEQQTYRLADDSVLHLNTDSAVTVRYDTTQRLVVLTSGEADFEVAHESGRAFRVLAGSAEVRDLGTKFDVRVENDSTLVTVVEGRVGVAPSPTSGEPAPGPQPAPRFVQLGADQQIRVTAGEVPAEPTAVDAQRTTAWLHRQIMFEREPLERVAREFNRYSRKPIEITAPALRSLEISGVFATDDTAGFIAFLRSLEGVRVEVTSRRILVSQD